MTRCKPHQRFNCVVCDPAELRRQRDTGGAGEVGINTDGHLTMGIGAGLTLDLQDSSTGVRTSPGFSVDTPAPPSYDPGPSYSSDSGGGASYDSGSY